MGTLEQIRNHLAHFTGTCNWYRHHLSNGVYTDGVKVLAELTEAYWLLDACFSYLTNPNVNREEFQTWKLERKEGDSFTLTGDDGNGNIIAKQEFTFSDFPLEEIKLYLINDKIRWTLLLPSEY